MATSIFSLPLVLSPKDEIENALDKELFDDTDDFFSINGEICLSPVPQSFLPATSIALTPVSPSFHPTTSIALTPIPPQVFLLPASASLPIMFKDDESKPKIVEKPSLSTALPPTLFKPVKPDPSINVLQAFASLSKKEEKSIVPQTLKVWTLEEKNVVPQTLKVWTLEDYQNEKTENYMKLHNYIFNGLPVTSSNEGFFKLSVPKFGYEYLDVFNSRLREIQLTDINVYCFKYLFFSLENSLENCYESMKYTHGKLLSIIISYITIMEISIPEWIFFLKLYFDIPTKLMLPEEKGVGISESIIKMIIYILKKKEDFQEICFSSAIINIQKSGKLFDKIRQKIFTMKGEYDDSSDDSSDDSDSDDDLHRAIVGKMDYDLDDDKFNIDDFFHLRL